MTAKNLSVVLWGTQGSKTKAEVAARMQHTLAAQDPGNLKQRLGPDCCTHVHGVR